MRDVAGQAGVSLQTVSNYVNGRFNLMSVETRERVGRELDGSATGRTRPRGACARSGR